MEFIGEGMGGIDVLGGGGKFEGKREISGESRGYVWGIGEREELMNGDLNK